MFENNDWVEKATFYGTQSADLGYLDSPGTGLYNGSFGDYMSLSGDGLTLAVGAPGWYYFNGSNSYDDTVHILHYVDGEWIPKGQIIYYDVPANQ